MPRPPSPGCLDGRWPSAARAASLRPLPHIHPGGKPVTIVHYYLGRPARVWTAANPRRTGNRKPSVTAASGLPPAPPAGGLLARRRIAIARFGADVAAVGGIGPALA